MFARVRDWFRERRAWRNEHVAAWGPVAAQAADQLTVFQHQCREALVRAVPTLAFEKKKGKHESFLVATLPNTNSTVYIYLDGSNIQEPGRDFIAEEWDFKTPAELIEAVVAEARKRVAI